MERHSMKIHYSHNIFWAEATFHEKDALKQAGFWWHPSCNCLGECLACRAGIVKKWWTKDARKAARLVDYATSEAQKAIGMFSQNILDSRASDANVDLVSPPGLEYLPFQKAGIHYMTQRKHTLLGDEPGCVAGNTIVHINRAGKGMKITIEQLHRKLKRPRLFRHNHRWDLTTPTKIRALCDGVFRQHEIVDVLYKGVQPVYEVKTKTKSIRVTGDHEIACLVDTTTSIDWRAAAKIKKGTTILTNGKQVCPLCGTSENLITYKYSKFLGYCKTCMYRKKRRNHTYKTGKYLDGDGYVRVSGQQEHPRASNSGSVYEHILVMEKKLGRYVTRDEIIHHKDGNKQNNKLNNLKVTTHKNHMSHHGKQGNFKNLDNGDRVKFVPRIEKVTSVRKDGTAHVYDIVCKDPHRNFVANGIVVHNCGKTIQALGYINTQSNFRKALVICPATLRVNWARESEKWLTEDWEIYTIHTSDDLFDMDLDDPEERQMIIINYDKMGTKQETKVAVWQKLMSIQWDVMIADEAHFMKGGNKTQRARTVLGFYDNKGNLKEKGIVQHSDHILLLTGTPLPNRPKKLFPLLQAIDPQDLGQKFTKFAFRYCAPVRSRWGWDFDGASNLGELQDKLRSRCVIRRLKAEVLPELPPKRRQIIELAANGSEGDIRRQAEAFLRHEQAINTLEEAQETAQAMGDNDSFKAAAKSLTNARRIAFEETSRERHKVAMAKVPHAIEHVKLFLESCESKIILFAHHKDVVAALGKALSAEGYQYVTIVGDTPMNQRQINVDRFQNDSNIRVFIGNLQAAGTGITLTAADTAIFVEMDWVPANCQQCEDRIHRIGTTSSVLIQYLVFDGSVDAKMAKTLIAKMEIIDAALDTQEGLEKIEAQMNATPRRNKQFPQATEEQRAAAKAAITQLAAACDGANTRDGQGFNQMDARFSRQLAERSMQRELTNGEVDVVKRIAKKYRKQLGESLLLALWAVDDVSDGEILGDPVDIL